MSKLNSVTYAIVAPHIRQLPAKSAKVAILIPCYNEELTIAEVIKEFKTALPNADVYVFDNNSSDRTVGKATEAGAVVYEESRQGKGYVVQTMFREIEADIYVMIDGDGTYPVISVNQLIEPVMNGRADMVVGTRLHVTSDSMFRIPNLLGNFMYKILVNKLFRVRLTDILSGYRVFNRRLVRSLPLFKGGFETEAEMTIKALERGFTIKEIPVNLGVRPEGSFSKIRLLHDGWLILMTIFTLLRDYKPFTFFGLFGLSLIFLGLIPGVSVTIEFFRTGLVPRLPSAVLAMGLELSGLISIFVGFILHTIASRFQELDRQNQVLFEEVCRQRR